VRLEEEEVHDVWKTVVERVLEGRLGTGANLSTMKDPRKRTRWLCIETKDWTDEADVRHILNELVRLKLHSPEDGGIFYTCHFWVYLMVFSATVQKDVYDIYRIGPNKYSSVIMLRKHEEVPGSQDTVGEDTVQIVRKVTTNQPRVRRVLALKGGVKRSTTNGRNSGSRRRDKPAKERRV